MLYFVITDVTDFITLLLMYKDIKLMYRKEKDRDLN